MRSQLELGESCKILAPQSFAVQCEALEQQFATEELLVMLKGLWQESPSSRLCSAVQRVYSLRNFYFFVDHVLGYNERRPSPDPNNPSVNLAPGLHDELCTLVTTSPKRKRLFLVPRGHMKSTVLTVAHTIWLLCKNPNLRILLVSATSTTAESFLSEIKQHFDNNKTFRSLFPDRLPSKNDVWNQGEIQVGGRTIQAGVNSVEARGLDGNLVGRHYDRCKVDDAVTKDNVTTAEQRMKTIESLKALESVMEPYATWDIIGTRWHFYEAYQWLIDTNDEVVKLGLPAPYEIYIRKAIEDGTPIFPAKYSYEKLMEIKATQKEMYAKLYDNDPLPEEDREFRRSFFYFYGPEEIEPLMTSLKHRGTTVDIAVSQKKTADRSAVVTGAMHPNQKKGSIVVIDIDAGRVTTDKVADWVIKHHDAYGSRVGYEPQGQQMMFETVMKLITEKHKRYVPLRKLKGSNRANPERIRGLLPLVVKAPIWLPKDNRHTMDTLEEFERFPYSKHDDISVAIAYLMQLVKLNHVDNSEQEEAHEPDNELTGY